MIMTKLLAVGIAVTMLRVPAGPSTARDDLFLRPIHPTDAAK